MRRPTVCVDLDGVLAKYDKWRGIHHFGEPIVGSKEFVDKINEFADVLIYTTRCSNDANRDETVTVEQLKQLVKDWLDKYSFKYKDIYTGQGKPLCSAFVDDRAIHCNPQMWLDTTREYDYVLWNIKSLCKHVDAEDSK